MRNSLLIVHVSCRVKPEQVEAFREATLANARESVKEPGVARFDVIQDRDDPTRFVLCEAYRSADAPAAHKGDRPLPDLARHGGEHDGRAAHEPEVFQPSPGRWRMVKRRAPL